MKLDVADEAALAFIKEYATKNQFINGDIVLAEFRESKFPGSEGDWSTWGNLMSEGKRRSWYVKSSTVPVTSKYSHAMTTTQWQSRLFKGKQSLVGTTAKDQLEAIRKRLNRRDIGYEQALWKAYEVGLMQVQGEKNE